MTDQPTPARRVRVTSPRTGSPRRPPAGRTREIDEQTGTGRAYMRSLLAAQLRAGLRVVVTLTVVVGGLPLALAAVPALRSAHLGGLGLPWLILGAGVYPLLVGLAWWYVRAVERAERDFTDLLHH